MAETAIMDRRKWLLRMIYVRLVAFTVLVSIEAISNLTHPDAFAFRKSDSIDMLLLLVVVYALSALWLGILRVNESFVWQSYAQIGVDLLLITWAINRTGGVDSNLTSLYFLEIVISSILLEKRGAFMTGTASSVI